MARSFDASRTALGSAMHTQLPALARLVRYDLQPGLANEKTIMKTTNYAAFVGLDWGDRTHAFALQFAATEAIETGTLAANAETFHHWLEALQIRCAGQRVALAIEAGRSALLFAMAEHPWLDLFPIHPSTCDRFRAAFRPSGAKDDIPDAQTLLTLVAQHREKLQR
jgi:hypothetical protein